MTPEKAAFVAQKTLAVVGVSRTRGFGNQLLSHLAKRGYRVFPINREADKVEGQTCYRRLDDLPEPVGGVVIVVPPSETEKVVEDCARLGIKHVWIQQGAESEKALALCEEKGISAVHGDCLMMHTEAGFPHSLHRFIWKLLGKY